MQSASTRATSASTSATSASTRSTRTPDEPSPTQKYADALNKYYRHKAKYDAGVAAKKAGIKKLQISNKEKRAKFRKLVPNCMSCGRAVRSDFSMTVHGETVTHLAKCGDASNPCQLDIELVTTKTIDVRHDVPEYIEKRDAYGKRIITLINDGMFGYLTSDEVVDKHAKYEKLDDEISVIRERMISAVDDIYTATSHQTSIIGVNNKAAQRQLYEMTGLFNEHVATIKENVAEYARSGQKQFVRDAVHLYLNEMRDNLNALYAKKYAYMEVEYQPKQREYVLCQKVLSLDSWLLDEDEPQVVRFFIGKKTARKPVAATSSSLMSSAIPPINRSEWSSADDDSWLTGKPPTPPLPPPTQGDSQGSSESYHPMSNAASSESYHPASDDSIPFAPASDDSIPFAPASDDSIPFAPASSDSIPFAPASSNLSDDESDDEYSAPSLRIGDDISSSLGVVPPPPPLDDGSMSTFSDGSVPPPPTSHQ